MSCLLALYDWLLASFLQLFFPQSPLLWSVCILAGYQSEVVSPSAGFPERRGVPIPSHPSSPPPRPSGPGPGSSVPWIPWNAEELWRPQGARRKQKQAVHIREGEEVSGTKDNFYFMNTYCWAWTCGCLNNLYADNNPGEGGGGVGLQTLWAREEEWVPGDVILTGRGQLSQYNGLQEKRSHRKTENTKPSPAIFSLMRHSHRKSMKNLPVSLPSPLAPLQALCVYDNNLSCAPTPSSSSGKFTNGKHRR